MSIEYTIYGDKFTFDYRQTKEAYEYIINLPDIEFIEQLPFVIHMACFICFIKGVNLNDSLSDLGIVHQLVHLIHIPNEKVILVDDVRQKFKDVCKLA